ncbi:hypothetical protein KR084_004833, partial [Drosophila pseudotakahashii]
HLLQKYYPPDFDPSKIPRMKLAKNRQYTVRLMAPFNMRCKTCGEYIYKGKKFNARKEDVDNETYLGIRIYRFYIKCTRCLQEISFKTDPQNTDYEIEAGATRNFMALKLAEEQARREEQELRDEEANNPMKLLENRTQQSRNEIEMIESLEELRDLNRRQQTVDYNNLLQQYNTVETERERLEREEREDEEFIKLVLTYIGYLDFPLTAFNSFRSVNFKNKAEGGSRVVAEEIIEEVKDEPLDLQPAPPPAKQAKSSTLSVSAISSSKVSSSQPLVKRKTPLVLVKPKAATVATATESKPTATSSSVVSTPAETKAPNPPAAAPAGLSLLSAYSDSSEDSN